MDRMASVACPIIVVGVAMSSARCSRCCRPAIIATGRPDGIGAKQNPPVWMKAGDVLEIEISGIGTLRNKIADEK